jgi:hypothetical protein
VTVEVLQAAAIIASARHFNRDTPTTVALIGCMSRFAETETAVVARLRAFKAAPKVSINLSDLGAPMHAAGFSQHEIKAVLDALEQDKILSYGPGNRLLILKNLPE